MNRYMAVGMACLALAAMLVGCHSENDQPTAAESSVQAGESQQIEAVETTEAAEQKGIVISTKFGDLYYQDQWENLMHVEVAESDTYVIAAFEAEINDVRYPLFHLTIGEYDGDPVGRITDSQGTKHDVFVYMEEISGFSDLTEGEQNRLFAMQEEINFIIENME